MSAADIHALAGAYALDALDDLERAAFARHLAECDACATEVAELREAAARLADGTWAVPPPGLRSSVLAEVSRTRQLAPGTPERAPQSAAVRRWRKVTAAAVAAGIVAVGAGALSTAIQQERVADQRAIAARAQAETAKMQAVLSAPDVAMRTGGFPGGGRATVVMSPNLDAGVVVVSELPSPPTGKTYQLWLMRADNSAVSVGVLDPAAHASRNLVGSVEGMKTFGVSLEPVGGSKTPSKDIVATMSLA